MYDFHYNYIRLNYESKAKLLFTVTDSLTYEIQAEDVQQDFWNDRDLFHYIEQPERSQYFDKTNKKVPGKFKDESPKDPIVEFVGLRSKMYSYAKDIRGGDKKCKGIKNNVITREIRHKNYR